MILQQTEKTLKQLRCNLRIWYRKKIFSGRACNDIRKICVVPFTPNRCLSLVAEGGLVTESHGIRKFCSFEFELPDSGCIVNNSPGTDCIEADDISCLRIHFHSIE